MSGFPFLGEEWYPFGLRAKKEGFQMLFRPADTEYGVFPTAVITAREIWLKEPKNRRTAVNFLRALREGKFWLAQMRR